MSRSVAAQTPVLVGWSSASQRLPAGEGCDALGLMQQALRGAALASGADPAALLAGIQWIGVPRGLWGYSDPGRALATAVGAVDAHTVMAEIGVLQQSLINRACAGIADGQFDIAVVAGGEAKYREQQARRAQLELSDADATPGAEPDEVWRPADELWSDVEQQAGLGMAVGYYAIMENALRSQEGLSLPAHRNQLAELYAGFAAQAADNPDAWEREPLTAQQIRDPGPGNRMLAFPYTRHHNSQWNVDQAAALIFCSAAAAERLGIPRRHWLFPLAGTESNHMVNTAQRPDLASSPGARIAGARALELAGLTAEQINLVDLYSCFPVAVRVYARELGLGTQRPLTVTGGMARAGGPLNNYVLQATVRAADLLSAGHGRSALISSVSGMLTKQAFGIYATEPRRTGFGFEDVTERVAAEWPARPLRAPEVGEAAIIVGYTVLYEGDRPVRLVAVCDLSDAERTVVWSDQPALMAAAQAEEWVGRQVVIGDNAQIRP